MENTKMIMIPKRKKINKISKTIFLLIIVIILSISKLFSQELNLDLLKAKAFYNLNKYDSAIVYANKVKDKDLIYQAVETRALSELKKNDYKNALKDFLKLNKQGKEKNSIYISELYAQKKDWKNAALWLRKHLQSPYKKNPGAIKIDKFFDEFYHTKQWNDIWMEDWYSELETEIAEAQYLAQKKKYTELLEVTDEILEEKINCYKIHYLRAQIYNKLDDQKNRIFSLKNACRYSANNSLYTTEYAKALLDNGKFKKAVEQFEKAINLDKYNPELYYYMALTYYRYNDFENAKKYINYYRKISPQDANGIWLAGYIYKDLGDYKKAIEEFNAGIDMNICRVGYYTGKGECLYNMQKYDEATIAFSMALDLSPEDGKIYYQRGLAYFDKGDRTQACRDWEKASELGYFQADDLKLMNCQ